MTFRCLFYDRSVEMPLIESFDPSARSSLSNPNVKSYHLRKRGYSGKCRHRRSKARTTSRVRGCEKSGPAITLDTSCDLPLGVEDPSSGLFLVPHPTGKHRPRMRFHVAQQVACPTVIR